MHRVLLLIPINSYFDISNNECQINFDVSWVLGFMSLRTTCDGSSQHSLLLSHFVQLTKKNYFLVNGAS